MLRRLGVAALFASSVFLLSYAASSAATKTINRPMFNGNRLDWCLKWSEDCGRPAADAYCRSQGYARATFFFPDRHIGARSPTRLIGTGATCDLNHCDGFRQIVCLKRPLMASTPRPAATPFRLARTFDRPAAPRFTPMRLASAGPVMIKPPIPMPRPVLASVTPREAPIRGISSEELNEDKSEGTKPEATASASDAVSESLDKTEAAATDAVVAEKAVQTAKADEAVPAKITSFEKPMYNGKRLAWCHQFDSECGKPAADAFCKANGFTAAAEFSQDPHIGDVAPTRSMGSGAVCDQVPCDGFKVIACTM